MNFTPKTQTLPLSLPVCAIAATLGVMVPQAVFAEDLGNDVPPLSRCLTVADLNGDGILNLADSLAGMQLDLQDSADYYAKLINTGCSYYLDFGSDSSFIANLAEYSARCAMTDMNGDNVLDYDDSTLVLSSNALTVTQKLLAIEILSTGSSGMAIDDDSQTPVVCRFVVEDGPLYIFPGYADRIVTRLNNCLGADLNGDNTLDVADLTYIYDPNVDLTIPERIAYAAAVRDRLCPAVLQ
jgi:hypothetical protein